MINSQIQESCYFSLCFVINLENNEKLRNLASIPINQWSSLQVDVWESSEFHRFDYFLKVSTIDVEKKTNSASVSSEIDKLEAELKKREVSKIFNNLCELTIKGFFKTDNQ